jgi:hypothetical protein
VGEGDPIRVASLPARSLPLSLLAQLFASMKSGCGTWRRPATRRMRCSSRRCFSASAKATRHISSTIRFFSSSANPSSTRLVNS